jgi:hypothetical protein
MDPEGLAPYPREMEAELGRDLARELATFAAAIALDTPRDWPGFRDAVHRYLDGLGARPHPDPFFNWVGVASLPRSGIPPHRNLPLRDGMTVTIGHPVLAIPGVGGVRFEDVYRVNPDGGAALSPYPILPEVAG